MAPSNLQILQRRVYTVVKRNPYSAQYLEQFNKPEFISLLGKSVGINTGVGGQNICTEINGYWFCYYCSTCTPTL
jgi:hypothetical protein